MDNIILADYTFTNKYALAEINGGILADMLKESISELAEEISADVKIIGVEKYSESLKETWGERYEGIQVESSEDYLAVLENVTKGYKNVIHVFGDTVLLDAKEASAALKQHEKAFAFYTYGENYPLGIVPFIFKPEIFPRLYEAQSKTKLPLSDELIHKLIFDDPNFFEIEVIVSKADMRYYRLDMRANSKRGVTLINKVVANAPNDYKARMEYIVSNPTVRRTLPAYAEIDITGVNNRKGKYSPKTKGDSELSLSDFDSITKSLTELADDVHISIGAFGEPLEHPQIKNIISSAVENIRGDVYIETNGELFDTAFSEFILSLKTNRLKVIFHLDTVNEVLYSELYDKNNLKEVLANIEAHIKKAPKTSYIQITKMKDNFDELESFYKYFDKYEAQIILRKYDSYCGKMEDRKVGDLSPLVNVGCWHLTRDMFIHADASVSACKEDFAKEIVIGNILTDGAEKVWRKCEENYLLNIKGEMKFCEHCDEWFTYNF